MSPELTEGSIAARGISDSMSILSRRFDLLATNVPFLGRVKQSGDIKAHFDRNYKSAKGDTATAMISRLLDFAKDGPAVWLRAAVAGAVLAVVIPEGSTPILYLPGVARETLKGADDCPALLQPLVWFTVAGTVFGHVNGKDWTLRGFLTSERGPLKLGIADDNATRTALPHAALRFCTRPVEELRGQRWNADQLNALLAPDLPPTCSTGSTAPSPSWLTRRGSQPSPTSPKSS